MIEDIILEKIADCFINITVYKPIKDIKPLQEIVNKTYNKYKKDYEYKVIDKLNIVLIKHYKLSGDDIMDIDFQDTENFEILEQRDLNDGKKLIKVFFGGDWQEPVTAEIIFDEQTKSFCIKDYNPKEIVIDMYPLGYEMYTYILTTPKCQFCNKT